MVGLVEEITKILRDEIEELRNRVIILENSGKTVDISEGSGDGGSDSAVDPTSMEKEDGSTGEDQEMGVN